MGQLPTGEADLIVGGLAERVHIIRTRVPASVETVVREPNRPSRIRDLALRRLRGGRSPVGGYLGRPASSIHPSRPSARGRPA